jgi:hypothetical protein
MTEFYDGKPAIRDRVAFDYADREWTGIVIDLILDNAGISLSVRVDERTVIEVPWQRARVLICTLES